MTGSLQQASLSWPDRAVLASVRSTWLPAGHRSQASRLTEAHPAQAAAAGAPPTLQCLREQPKCISLLQGICESKSCGNHINVIRHSEAPLGPVRAAMKFENKEHVFQHTDGAVEALHATRRA